MSENNLEFQGATWYRSTSDAWVAYVMLQRGQAANDVCQLIEGYSDPCPTGNARNVSS